MNLEGSAAKTMAYSDSKDFPPKILGETKCQKNIKKTINGAAKRAKTF
jgi:hypothetical protein